jgi:hypothetical protein
MTKEKGQKSDSPNNNKRKHEDEDDEGSESRSTNSDGGDKPIKALADMTDEERRLEEKRAYSKLHSCSVHLTRRTIEI